MTTRYPCRTVHPIDPTRVGSGPCAGTATYFAIDNRARLGHVCRLCWRELPEAEQALYAKDPL